MPKADTVFLGYGKFQSFKKIRQQKLGRTQHYQVVSVNITNSDIHIINVGQASITHSLTSHYMIKLYLIHK